MSEPIARPLHTFTEVANPFLECDLCAARVTHLHTAAACAGCPDNDGYMWNIPCGHSAGALSACPTWGPVDGCQCVKTYGEVPHAHLGQINA